MGTTSVYACTGPWKSLMPGGGGEGSHEETKSAELARSMAWPPVSIVQLGEGEKVLLFLAAANRDPRKWEHADRYDIQRQAIGHVGFGNGIHGCVGQAVARMEGEIVLTALAKRVRAIELSGEPRLLLNNTLRGWASLPVKVVVS